MSSDAYAQVAREVLKDIGGAITKESSDGIYFEGGGVPGRPFVILTRGAVKGLAQSRIVVEATVSAITYIPPAFICFAFGTILWFSTRSLGATLTYPLFGAVGFYIYANAHAKSWIECQINKRAGFVQRG